MVTREASVLVHNDAAGEQADGAVVLAAVAGDRPAFEALYEQHHLRIFNLALRSTGDPQEAEDICQEVWARVHRSLGGLRAVGAFDAWLTRVTTRVCIDASRRRQPTAYGEEQLAQVESGAADFGDKMAEREQKLIAWQALGSLAPRQRIALYLREVDGRDYRQIADALCTSQSAVQTLLFRARQSLGRSFGELQASPAERCKRARHLMAVVIDGEGDRAEEHSLKAHLRTCHNCQRTMFDVRRGRRAYAGLPFAMAGGLRVVLPLGSSGGGVSVLGALKLGSLFAKVQAFITPAVAATALTAAVAVPFVASDATLRADAASLPFGPYETSERIAVAAQADPGIGLATVSVEPLPTMSPSAAGLEAALRSQTAIPGPVVADTVSPGVLSSPIETVVETQAEVTTAPLAAPVEAEVATVAKPVQTPSLPDSLSSTLPTLGLPPGTAPAVPVVSGLVQSLPTAPPLPSQITTPQGGLTGGVANTVGGLAGQANGVVGPVVGAVGTLPSQFGGMRQVPYPRFRRQFQVSVAAASLACRREPWFLRYPRFHGWPRLSLSRPWSLRHRSSRCRLYRIRCRRASSPCRR